VWTTGLEAILPGNGKRERCMGRVHTARGLQIRGTQFVRDTSNAVEPLHTPSHSYSAVRKEGVRNFTTTTLHDWSGDHNDNCRDDRRQSPADGHLRHGAPSSSQTGSHLFKTPQVSPSRCLQQHYSVIRC
jgi:hypothetical protein